MDGLFFIALVVTGDRNKKYSSPNLTVKRSFTARNVGDLPIYVHGFSISGLECEGYGFAVLNCAPFLLLPNSTRKIDIAFTPDFTLSKVSNFFFWFVCLNLYKVFFFLNLNT